MPTFDAMWQHDPSAVERLYDTYHGVYISVRYTISVDCTRGFMSKNLKHQIEVTPCHSPFSSFLNSASFNFSNCLELAVGCCLAPMSSAA
jgi:hypothetical protein